MIPEDELECGELCEKSSLTNPKENRLILVNDIPDNFSLKIYSKLYSIYMNVKVKIMNSNNSP
jgi:hypothetical protein